MKFKSFIYTALASALLFTSCDLNKQHVFNDDTQAFIAFAGAKSSVSVSESTDAAGSVIEIPMLCASVKGVTATVNFALTDTAYAENLRAVEGVHYVVKSVITYTLDAQNNRINEVVTDLSVAGTEQVIKFDADHRFATLVIETIDNDSQDGDKKFDVVLTGAQGCQLGAFDTYAVTISDDESPMNLFVGTYTLSGTNAFDGTTVTWDVNVYRDDVDENKIWLQPIATVGGLSAAQIMPVYALVDLVAENIQLPYGQTIYGGPDLGINLVIAGYNGEPVLNGAAVCNYVMDGKSVSFTIPFLGTGETVENAWWYSATENITLTKK